VGESTLAPRQIASQIQRDERFSEESRQMDASRVIFIHRANAVNIALDKRKQTI
jgi:hypothetical protein